MYKVEETFLLFLGQGKLVPEIGIAPGKAAVQVRMRGTALFQIFGIYGYNDTFILHIVNLGDIMAFILIDEKNVSGIKIVKPVVN